MSSRDDHIDKIIYNAGVVSALFGMILAGISIVKAMLLK